jgi:hypothetical protein
MLRNWGFTPNSDERYKSDVPDCDEFSQGYDII